MAGGNRMICPYCRNPGTYGVIDGGVAHTLGCRMLKDDINEFGAVVRKIPSWPILDTAAAMVLALQGRKATPEEVQAAARLIMEWCEKSKRGGR